MNKEEQKKRIKEIREAKNVFPIFSTYPKWYKDPVIYLYGIPLILGFICIIIFCR